MGNMNVIDPLPKDHCDLVKSVSVIGFTIHFASIDTAIVDASKEHGPHSQARREEIAFTKCLSQV
jgi:hypothetical protein